MQLHPRTIAVALCVALVAQLPAGLAPSEARSASLVRHSSVAVAVPPVRVQVTEPPRARPSMAPTSTIRPKVVPGVRPANGVPLPGPAMVHPAEIDRVQRAAARRGGSAAAHGVRRAQSLPSNPTGSGSGINPWWRYQEESLPGGGRAMVNVGTGNLIVQDDDMTVPHKGIALAFRRTYNSQNSASVTSGETPARASLYGNGWTSTFDAHIVASSSGMSVYDIDGARYDYVPSGGGWSSATPGEHATLYSDGGCGMMWFKKSGTMYYFYMPTDPGTCPSLGGWAGRLYQIVGRNRNTFITFGYGWDNNDYSVNGKVNLIRAQTESGLTANLTFADVSGRRLLQQLTFPDTVTSVSYGYDGNGNLSVVTKPANNAAGTHPVHSYGYATLGGDWVISWAASPRWNACVPFCGGDGGYTVFGIVGPSALASTFTGFAHVAVVNPVPNDGTSSALQSGYPSTAMVFLTSGTAPG